MVKRWLILIPALCAGCSSGNSTNTAVADSATVNSSLAVNMTDAPPDVDTMTSVFVTMARVQAHLVASTSATQSDPQDSSIDSDDHWEPLAVTETTFDLLALQNGVTKPLGGVDLPAGKVTELRFFVDPNGVNSVLKKDGSMCPIDVSQVASSGIKIQESFPVLSLDKDKTTTVTVDLDVRASLSMDAACAYTLLPKLKVRHQEQGERGSDHVFGHPPRFGADGSIEVQAVDAHGQDSNSCSPAHFTGNLSVNPFVCSRTAVTPVLVRGDFGDPAIMTVTAPDGTTGVYTSVRQGTCAYAFGWIAGSAPGLYQLAVTGGSATTALRMSVAVSSINSPACHGQAGGAVTDDAPLTDPVIDGRTRVPGAL